MDGLKVTRHPFLPGALSRKKSGESDYFLRLVTKILGDFIAPVQKNHFPFYFPVQKIPWFFNPQLYFYPSQNKMDVCERINVENNDDKAQKLLLYKINKFNKTPPLTKSWKMSPNSRGNHRQYSEAVIIIEVVVKIIDTVVES